MAIKWIKNDDTVVVLGGVRVNTGHRRDATYSREPIFINPFKPEFTIVIFIHYKPRIAVAILDL